MEVLVRAACLTNYAEVAKASGLNPDRMLLDAGLSPNVLDEPDLMIPSDRFGSLLQASAMQSGNESFGLCMARSRLLSNLGVVGLLIRDQETLRDSLELLLRYLTFVNGAITLVVEETGDSVLIREVLLTGRTHEPIRQRVELALGVMVRLVRQLIGREWRPRSVLFEHSAPRDLSVHNELFGRHVVFDAEFNGILCDRSDLDTRNEFADPAMARYAQQLLDALRDNRGEAVLDDLRRIILLLLPGGGCTIEKVSEYMGVAPRTIQRRLIEQQKNFSALVNDIRKELAARYVGETNRTLTDIADLLGFTALSGFSRWYQTQFGCSAKESRAKAAAAQRSTGSPTGGSA